MPSIQVGFAAVPSQTSQYSLEGPHIVSVVSVGRSVPKKTESIGQV